MTGATAADGQNWGFPTYNWEAMAETGYAWWRRRLSCMGQYFQAYRIDHILGFFRIWQIPGHGVSGMLGRFYPAYPVHRHELERMGVWDFDRLTGMWAHAQAHPHPLLLLARPGVPLRIA